MQHSSTNARGLRRGVAAVAAVAGAVLLIAPVAGASAGAPPPAADHGQERAEANAPDQIGGPHEPGEQGNGTGVAANNGAQNPQSPGASGVHKQTICHRTASATNPYVMITVDFHAVDGEIVDSKGDHAERHQGPVFDQAMSSGDKWGDIIPPFTTTEGASFAGLNWTSGGQALFRNGCQIPTPETPDEPEEEPEPEDEPEPEPDDEPEQPTVPEDDEPVAGPTPTEEGVAPLETEATPEPEVLGEVTVRTPTAPETPEVAGTTATPTAAQPISALPRTGSATPLLTAAGAALVGLGLVLRRSGAALARS